MAYPLPWMSANVSEISRQGPLRAWNYQEEDSLGKATCTALGMPSCLDISFQCESFALRSPALRLMIPWVGSRPMQKWCTWVKVDDMQLGLYRPRP